MRRLRKHYPRTECWLPHKVLVVFHTVLGTWSSVNITTTASSLSLIFPFHLRPDPVLFIGKLPQRSDTSRLALNGGQMVLKSFSTDNFGKIFLRTEKNWNFDQSHCLHSRGLRLKLYKFPSSGTLVMRENASHDHISSWSHHNHQPPVRGILPKCFSQIL